MLIPSSTSSVDFSTATTDDPTMNYAPIVPSDTSVEGASSALVPTWHESEIMTAGTATIGIVAVPAVI